MLAFVLLSLWHFAVKGSDTNHLKEPKPRLRRHAANCNHEMEKGDRPSN